MPSPPTDRRAPERVLFVGMMGAGKSTVGMVLARRSGSSFVDTDAVVEQKAGMTVAEMFAEEGEAAFRAAESDAIAGLASTEGPLVVSVGGGAVLSDANRTALRAAGTVVWLRARPAVLAARVGPGHDRPLLARSGTAPGEALERLVAERTPLYKDVADIIVDVDELSPEEAAELVLARLAQHRPSLPRPLGGAKVGGFGPPIRALRVDLGYRTYPVLVGPGSRHSLGSVVPAGAVRAAVVTQKGVGVEVDAGLEQRTFLIGDGEEAKSLRTVEELCRDFARFGLTRADVVVGVGGGVVTDVAGFAAAVYHRGVAVAHVATTLLGQVDAAIGGKTGVNLPEGKNLVGAFWQPVAVICDTDVLSSLAPREYRSGLGEMAKYAFLGVPDLAHLDIEEAVARCVECKAGFVAGDERETQSLDGDGPVRAGRALLNYGHTLAHALESVGHYDLRHGEAVAIGLVFAARLARRLERVSNERVVEHDRVVAAYDLPSRLPAGVDLAEVVGSMRRDKKATGGGLTFVLDGPAGLEVVRGVPEAAVLATLADLR